MRKKLHELERHHRAVAELLECGLLSPSTRDQLEREIAFVRMPDAVSIVIGNDRGGR
jgi:hypothetical protein